MAKHKKYIRIKFRKAVFERDGYQCVACGQAGSDRQEGGDLDAHHITPRKEMPNGGYVKENGITLCSWCHWKAESTLEGSHHDGFEPDNLYQMIRSSKEIAIKADS